MSSWEAPLRETLLDYLGAEQEPYSVANCCTFVIDYYRRKTGTDYSHAFNYKSAEDANDLLQSVGGILAVFESLLGPPSVPEPGAVVIVKLGEESTAAGVYAGDYVHVYLPERGLGRVPASRILAAWS